MVSTATEETARSGTPSPVLSMSRMSARPSPFESSLSEAVGTAAEVRKMREEVAVVVQEQAAGSEGAGDRGWAAAREGR